MQASNATRLLNNIMPAAAESERLGLVQRARISTSLLFLVDGMTFGTWAALIPSCQQKFELSPAKLSIVLLGVVAGAMVSMPLAGKAIERWGSHRVASPASVGFAATLLQLAFAPSYPVLIVAALCFGLWKGALDVSINSQAITVENGIGRPINGSFQGCWSFGGLSAASLLSLLMRHGLSPVALMTGMTLLLLAPAAWSFGRLPPDVVSSRNTTRPKASKNSSLLWLLGGLAFLALFSEGVMFDWSAVYIRTLGGFSVAQAPMGFAVFALCMAAGRFLGDRLTLTVGAANTLRISGLVLAGGIGAAVATHHWMVILVGFALVGFGTANIVPVIFSATGRLKGRGIGASLATVTTMGYLGFLSGPPLIGFVAANIGLASALSMVIVTGSVIAIVGGRTVRQAHSTKLFHS